MIQQKRWYFLRIFLGWVFSQQTEQTFRIPYYSDIYRIVPFIVAYSNLQHAFYVRTWTISDSILRSILTCPSPLLLLYVHEKKNDDVAYPSCPSVTK